MKNILTKIKTFIATNKSHILSFIIPAVILLAAYAFVGIYPFGEKSVLAVDFSSQYVYFFDYLKNVIFGEEGLFYNWSGSLSGGFYGTFAYYIASPFNLIVLLFPRENITEGLLVMLIAKISCAGLTMSLFLRKHRKYSEFTAVVFSLCYALCGYSCANTINPMWLDAVALLPLIIMGLERMCRKRGFMLYTLTLLFAIMANYYTGYMLCIFSLLYFAFLISSRKTFLRKQKIGIFLFSSASAVFMAGIIIVPAVAPLFEGKLSGGLDRVEFRECFNMLDGLLKFYPTVYDSQRYNGLPFLYCGLFALIFAILYFMCKKVAVRERISSGVLCGLLMFSLYFKPLDNLWHGGRAPVWFEHRYSFLLIFMLVILGAKAFENLKELHARHFGTAFFILLALLLTANAFRSREFKNAEYIGLFTLTALAIAGVCALLVKLFPKKQTKAVIAIAVCAELIINTQSYLININGDFGYQKREEYEPQIIEMRETADRIKANDSGFYRVEKTFHRAFNDNIAAGIYGVSFSSSVYNENVLKMMRQLGFGQYDWHTRYNGSTMLTDDIFGIKYVMSKDEKLVPYSERDGIVYENPDALPIAFLADREIIGSEIDDENPFYCQENIASAILGNRTQFFTRIREYDFDLQNLKQNGTRYEKRNANADGIAEYTLDIPKSGPLYVYIPTYEEHTCALFVNGEYVCDYFGGFQHNVAYLGSFLENEQVTVEVRLYNSSAVFEAPIFCVLDETALKDFNSAIPKNEVQKTGNNALELSVNAKEDCALFTSIPYEKGWSAYIDGRKCEINTSVNDTLICLNIPKGEHTVKLVYLPDGFIAGVIASVCGAVIFIVMTLVRIKTRRRKKQLETED